MSLIAIDQVAALLAGRIEALARELLPAGKREGHEWRAGSLAGEAGQSLGVHLGGSKAGVWADFSTGETGDALDLVAQVLFRGNKGDALKWSLRWLGLDAGDPAAMSTARRVAAEQQERAAAAEAADEIARRKRALAMWLDGVPIEGTPADAYLRTRGIDLRQLAHMPAALRFVPDLWSSEAQARLPAMVAAIADGAGAHVATHRTYIEPVPDRRAPGAWRKASLRDPKMTFGTMHGGFIRLSRGASGRPWRDMRGDETVAFAEGIETALSVAVLMPEWRVAATVSLSNVLRMRLPPVMRRVVVCADRDPPGSKASETLPKVLRHLAGQAEVLVVKPDAPFKDWNDQLAAEQREAAAGGSTSLDVREPAPLALGTVTA